MIRQGRAAIARWTPSFWDASLTDLMIAGSRRGTSVECCDRSTCRCLHWGRWPRVFAGGGTAGWRCAVAAALAVSRSWTAPEEVPAFHLRVAPPPDSAFLVARNREGGVALSPDGTQLTFVARTGARVQLWLQRLDSGEARPLGGTDNAFYPFWSPDSRQIAFFTPDSLKTVSIDGGPVRTVSVSEPRATGGAWLAQRRAAGHGRRSWHPSDLGARWRVALCGRWRVAAGGAGNTHVPVLLEERHPGGVVRRPRRGPAPAETDIPHAAYSCGHPLFVRDRTLLAQPFDSASLTLSGEPFVVATGLLVNRAGTPATHISFSASRADSSSTQPAMRSATALARQERDTAGERRRDRRLSDGASFPRRHSRRLCTRRRRQHGHLDRRARSTGRARDARTDCRAVSDLVPDGCSLTFAAGLGNVFDLFRELADGSGAVEQRTDDKGPQHPMDGSDHGRYLALTRNHSGTGTDLKILALDDNGRQPNHVSIPPSARRTRSLRPGRRRARSRSPRRQRPPRDLREGVRAGQPASGAMWQFSTDGGQRRAGEATGASCRTGGSMGA